MNYLAHAYLSFGHPELLTGNMISDFVKGKKQYDYPEMIQKGIVLHRAIDRFTDEHEGTRAVKAPFRQPYRLYAGAFADVVFDHFLANDEQQFATPENLMQFSHETYDTLDHFQTMLPENFQRMLSPMREQNWLYHYRYDWGIGKSFQGLVRRSTYLTESEQAFAIFQHEKKEFSAAYQYFFPELLHFTYKTIDQLFHTL